MLPILVYDSDAESCALCSGYITEYVRKLNNAQFIASTYSADEARSMISANSGVMLVLLAVGDNPIDAFELGRHAMKTNRDNYVVYMVRCLNQVKLLSENCIRPAGLLVQPVTEDSVINLLDRIINDYQELCVENNDEFIVITSGSGTFRLSIAHILYVEATEKKVTIWTQRRCLSFRITLKYIEELLPPGRFMRCHRSYIVNLEKINFVDYVNMHIELVTGDKVYLSRAYKNDIKAALGWGEAEE